MADKPRKQVNYGSPGIKGAIHDLIESVSRATAPKSITQAKGRRELQEAEAMGETMNTERMRKHLQGKRKKS